MHSTTKSHADSTAIDDVDAKLRDLMLKYSSSSWSPDSRIVVNLYLHIGDNTPTEKMDRLPEAHRNRNGGLYAATRSRIWAWLIGVRVCREVVEGSKNGWVLVC